MSDRNEIVIVSGLPRSGTSLMMQMLALGGIEPLTDEIREADTDNPKGYYEFERAKKIKHDKEWLPDARGKAVKMISQLLYDLPDTEKYKVIFLRRDIDEIVVSQEKMLIRRGIPVPDREAIKFAFGAHLKRLFAWIALQASIDLIEVDYRELVTSPQAATNHVASFVSRHLNVERMLTAIDPTLYRNRDVAAMYRNGN